VRLFIIGLMTAALAFTGLAGVSAANATTTAAPTSMSTGQTTGLDRDDDRNKSRHGRDRDRDGRDHHKKRCVKKRIVVWRSHRKHGKYNDHPRIRVVIVKKHCFRY
jgi:Ni/Co efflux regulator RcnB